MEIKLVISFSWLLGIYKSYKTDIYQGEEVSLLHVLCTQFLVKKEIGTYCRNTTFSAHASMQQQRVSDVPEA